VLVEVETRHGAAARTGQVIEPMLTDQWFVAMNKVSARTQAPNR
jgi:valyl-tRNA synthetase